MKDKPTFWECFFHNCKGIVRCKDGRLFAIGNETKRKRINILVFIFFAIALSIIDIYLIINTTYYWVNTQFDYLFLLTLANILSTYISYRCIHFELIYENSEGYSSASSKKHNGKAGIITFAVLCIIMVFLLLNSSSLMYLKYALSGSAGTAFVTISESYMGENTQIGSVLYQVSSANEDNTIFLPASSDSEKLYIVITSTRNPESLRGNLDGLEAAVYKPVEPIPWFWEENYFVQKATLEVVCKDIRDGSALEMTCGNLHRKWVFDLPGEDAA